MKKHLIILIVLGFAFSASAQNTFWKKPEYGLSFAMNLPVIASKQRDTISMKSEWGTSIFFEFGNKKQWAYQTTLGFDRVKYNHNFDHVTTLNSSLTSGLTTFFSPKNMKGTRFFFGLEPTYVLARKTEFIDGSKGSGTVQKSADIDESFDLGFKAGISFEFKPHMALNLSYMEMLYGSTISNGYDGVPDQLEIGLQITFSKIKNANKVNYKRIAKAESKRLRDSSFMLFVLESRSTDIEKQVDAEDRAALQTKVNDAIFHQIEAILKYYKYSDFAICLDTNLTSILNGEFDGKCEFISDSTSISENSLSGMFIARVGEFVLAGNQSARLGVFVFDDKMNLYQLPFPHYTGYIGLEHYMDDPNKLNAMMYNLNEKLMLLYKSL
jgi:hypothetical protein